jgi:hypothetical protein
VKGDRECELQQGGKDGHHAAGRNERRDHREWSSGDVDEELRADHLRADADDGQEERYRRVEPQSRSVRPARCTGPSVFHARNRRRAHLAAFIGSAAFLAGLLAAAAAAVFPVMLHATGSDALSLTAYNASAPDSSLRIAIRWWLVGIPLVAIYFTTVFRIHRGKAVAAVGREGY